MKLTQSYPRRRTEISRAANDANPGICSECSQQVGWRSVGGRCWRCEMDAMKKRPPMYIERDVLSMSATASSSD